MPKNSKITIQRPGSTQDGAGQPIEGWNDVDTVWAEIRDISGREYIAAGAVQAEVTTRIRVWRRDDISAGMRVLHGAVQYQIIAPPLLEGPNTTLLLCKRGDQ